MAVVVASVGSVTVEGFNSGKTSQVIEFPFLHSPSDILQICPSGHCRILKFSWMQTIHKAQLLGCSIDPYSIPWQILSKEDSVVVGHFVEGVGVGVGVEVHYEKNLLNLFHFVSTNLTACLSPSTQIKRFGSNTSCSAHWKIVPVPLTHPANIPQSM